MLGTKNILIALLSAALTIAIGFTIASSEHRVQVEVMVWQSTADPSRVWISTRLADDGQWGDPVAVTFDRSSDNGRYSVGTQTWFIPMPHWKPPSDATCVGASTYYGETRNAVVRVRTPTGGGTAFHVGSGYFVTAGHVISGDPEWVSLTSHQLTPTRARVVGLVALADGDVGVLRANVPDDFPSLQRVGNGRYETTLLGGLLIVGYPQYWRHDYPRLRAVDIETDYAGGIWTSHGVDYHLAHYEWGPGSSGSPVVDDCGQLEGIVLGKVEYDVKTAFVYFLPWETLGQLLRNIFDEAGLR